MTLLDTNVLVYGMTPASSLYSWALRVIGECAEHGSAAINPIILAELCVGDHDPATVADRVLDWDIEIVDLPAVSSKLCADAYREYRLRRAKESGSSAPSTPLPDFFIGAHAQVMGWEIATADKGRFTTYFPSVPLRTPEQGSE